MAKTALLPEPPNPSEFTREMRFLIHEVNYTDAKSLGATQTAQVPMNAQFVGVVDEQEKHVFRALFVLDNGSEEYNRAISEYQDVVQTILENTAEALGKETYQLTEEDIEAYQSEAAEELATLADTSLEDEVESES